MKLFAWCGIAAILLSAATAHAGSVRQITSGTSDTASSADFGNTIAWNTGAAGNEYLPVCSANVPGALITIADEAGTSGSHAIYVRAPSGATINGMSYVLLNQNFGSITAQCDAISGGTTTNWMTVQTGGAPVSPTAFAPITVQTIADLRTFYPSSSLAYKTLVTVLGYWSPGDGGGGLYYWYNGSSATDDGGSVIKPSAATGNGRWLLEYSGQPLSIAQWGAKPDGQVDSTRSGALCQSGVGTDNAAAIQYAINFIGAGNSAFSTAPSTGGELHIPAGIYRFQTPLLLPGLPSYGKNDNLTGNIKIIGTGGNASELCFDPVYASSPATPIYAIDSTSGPPPQTQQEGPRSFVTLQDFTLVAACDKAWTTTNACTDFTPANGKPLNGIRLFNPRQAHIARVHIYGFPYGDGLTFYSGDTGGAWYEDVQDSFFGWWDQPQTTFVQGQSDALWLNRGVVFIGNEDNQAKADETLVIGSTFWNCKLACISYTGYDTTGNPGVPDPGQNGVLGGATEGSLMRDTLTGYQVRDILKGTASSANTTASIICFSPSSAPTPITSDGQLTVTMTGGVDAGQIAIVTGYTVSSSTCMSGGEIDIGGQFTNIPNTGMDTFTLGYRADGVLWDAQDSINIYGVYVEGVTQPFHLTANGSNDFNKYGGEIANTNGVYIVSDAPISGTTQGPGPYSITIQLASSMSALDGYYNGRLITVTTSGHTETHQIQTYCGSVGATCYCGRVYTSYCSAATVATIAASAWTTAPTSSSTYAILGGPWPASMTGGQDRGVTDNRPGAYNYPSMWYIPSHVLQRNPNDQTTTSAVPATFNESTIDSLFVNNTAASLGQGRVVKLDTGHDKSVVASSGFDQPNPLVVAGTGQVYQNGQLVAIARPGSEAMVWAYGCVNRGDPLVTSSHAGSLAQSDTSETNPGNILGYALTQLTTSGCTGNGEILARIR
jgi:hypothetical protein